MTQSHRSRLMRIPKQEQELHVFVNPLDECDKNESPAPPVVSRTLSEKQREALGDYDYQAPLTAHSLRPNSRWLIVRRNIHRIRFMGFNAIGKEGQLPDFYLGLQMARELKRAQMEIKNINLDEDFHVLKEFSLVGGVSGQTRKFDTRHVKPDDALIYDRLGEEPLALQNLLYYFSKQDIQHGTVFWDFLNEVNHVLNLKRKRTVLVQRLRRLALSLALVIFSFIGLMFCLMVISFISTATKMYDPEVVWMDQSIGGYSANILSTK